MSRFLSFLFFLSLFFYSFVGKAFSNIVRIEEEKMQVNLEQIRLTEDGIFVNINGYLVSIPHLEYDAKGYHCGSIAVWYCINRHPNPINAFPVCQICGAGPGINVE